MVRSDQGNESPNTSFSITIMIEPKHRPQEPVGGLGRLSDEGGQDRVLASDWCGQGSRNQEVITEKEIMGMGFM